MTRDRNKYRQSLLARLGSFLPRRTPPAKLHLTHPRHEDFTRSYPTRGLTPANVVRILQSADQGFPQRQFELFAEMLQKWPRLRAVENTRRLALTGLDWNITPATENLAAPNQRDRASQTAEYCAETLAALPSLRACLDHLASAIGYGIAVAELIWEDSRLVDLQPVPHQRLTADPHQPWRLRILTDDAPAHGLALDEYPNKWIVHRPRSAPGHFFDGGLLRASAPLFVAQNLSLKDWLIYSQVAGMPARVARFEPGLPEQDKRQLLNMLEKLSTDAVAIFSKNIELDFLNAGGGDTRTYETLQRYCNTEVTILWLGQHLTTDINAQGSRAAAEIHDRVREDLLVDDIADEAHTIRCDLLTPLVRLRFGDDAPIPDFQRALVQSTDTRALAETLSIAVRDLGLRVSAAWVHRALGIPPAESGDDVLTGGPEA